MKRCPLLKNFLSSFILLRVKNSRVEPLRIWWVKWWGNYCSRKVSPLNRCRSNKGRLLVTTHCVGWVYLWVVPRVQSGRIILWWSINAVFQRCSSAVWVALLIRGTWPCLKIKKICVPYLFIVSIPINSVSDQPKKGFPSMNTISPRECIDTSHI